LIKHFDAPNALGEDGLSNVCWILKDSHSESFSQFFHNALSDGNFRTFNSSPSLLPTQTGCFSTGRLRVIFEKQIDSDLSSVVLQEIQSPSEPSLMLGDGTPIKTLRDFILLGELLVDVSQNQLIVIRSLYSEYPKAKRDDSQNMAFSIYNSFMQWLQRSLPWENFHAQNLEIVKLVSQQMSGLQYSIDQLRFILHPMIEQWENKNKKEEDKWDALLDEKYSPLLKQMTSSQITQSALNIAKELHQQRRSDLLILYEASLNVSGDLSLFAHDQILHKIQERCQYVCEQSKESQERLLGNEIDNICQNIQGLKAVEGRDFKKYEMMVHRQKRIHTFGLESLTRREFIQSIYPLLIRQKREMEYEEAKKFPHQLAFGTASKGENGANGGSGANGRTQTSKGEDGANGGYGQNGGNGLRAKGLPMNSSWLEIHASRVECKGRIGISIRVVDAEIKKEVNLQRSLTFYLKSDEKLLLDCSGGDGGNGGHGGKKI
jgi:hypothetical protein